MNWTIWPGMSNQDNTLIILDDGRFGRARVYERPIDIVHCTEGSEVEQALARLETARAGGLHAAGFLSYELGYALESRIESLMPADTVAPLLKFGLFEEPRILEGESLAAFLHERIIAGHRLSPPSPFWDRAAYTERFNHVRNHISAGDVYQVNLTFPLSFDLDGDPLSLWCALRARQPVAHGGFIRMGDVSLLSVSPELFIETRDGVITSRPMKGTAPREEDGDDGAAADRLHRDEKSRAENLMIVDLIRNDLSRVTEPGSVHVPALYTVESYPRFFGMTSTVRGRLREGLRLREIIGSLFPCGSVTGAPKIRAQQIIRDLESGPRGVYTGSMGYIAPDGDLAFNVAIRTARIDGNGRGVMGIGSGIVWDSDCDAEYDECLLKAAFLAGEAEPFRLIETMLWTPEDGFHLLAEHMERLAASATFFDFVFDLENVIASLEGGVAGLAPGPHRVRLLLDERGGTEVTAAPVCLPRSGDVWRYVFSPKRVQSCDPFLRHKTTRRKLYDNEHARLSRETGCDEVLFLNERGELAEGSRTNIFVRRGGALYTPPLACGVLAGVLRHSLMRDPDVRICERILYPDDLKTADEILLGNSVRGLIPAQRMGSACRFDVDSRA